ncbi:MAG: hypothetical protein CMJ33_01565 [Phycisphaerae bacterium]|nr:hypothetical protein [Phycisphaerae bacterium]
MNDQQTKNELSQNTTSPESGPNKAQNSILRDLERKARVETLLMSVLRAVFVVLVIATVALTFTSSFREIPTLSVELLVGLVMAALGAAALVIIADVMTPKKQLASVLGIYVGVSFGLIAALGLSQLIDVVAEAWELNEAGASLYISLAKGIGGLSLVYLSVSIVLTTKDDIRLVIPYIQFEKRNSGRLPLLIDTSVLIDGRITGLAKTGIIDSTLIIPTYVINELQKLADSSDRTKRERGRRGLDMVQELQRVYPQTKLVDPNTEEVLVDRMILDTAKKEGFRLFTNDLALAKIAEIQSVPVVNVHDIVGALRSDVMPGETLDLLVVREGETADQGVAFLPDGSMVVVENASEQIGRTCEIRITNSLQRPGGRLFFGKLVRQEETEHSTRRRGSTEHGTTTREPARGETPDRGSGSTNSSRNPRRKN